MELSLIENIQRENLTPIEEAEGYRSLTDKVLPHARGSRPQGGEKNRSTVTNLLRLLQLPHEVQDFLRHGQLQMGHAARPARPRRRRRPARAGPPRSRGGKWPSAKVEKAVANQRVGPQKKRRLPKKIPQRPPHPRLRRAVAAPLRHRGQHPSHRGEQGGNPDRILQRWGSRAVTRPDD